MKKVLVTGGAGYIGSHTCKALARAGFLPIAFDNLTTGWADAVRYGPLVRGDLMDRAAVDAAMMRHRPVAVMHFAALSLVGESMQDPARYWRTNVAGALNLIESCVAHGVQQFVFSSTCAIYGDQDGLLLDEATPTQPINAYGGSKRAIEDMLGNFGASFGLRSVVFRYFNVAGADPEGELGEQHYPETHLIPLLLEVAAGKRQELTVFGDDYPTRDGTCVRDYVHVADLAEAHVCGLRWLLKGKESRVFCLGSGKGFTVGEVVDAARSVTEREIPIRWGPRRAGDAATLVSGSRRASDELEWNPTHSNLQQMISDAWSWAQKPSYRR